MRTSRKTDFRRLKITLVIMTYHSQRPQCPSLFSHVLLNRVAFLRIFRMMMMIMMMLMMMMMMMMMMIIIIIIIIIIAIIIIIIINVLRLRTRI